MNNLLRISEATLLALHGMVYLVHRADRDIVSIKDMAVALNVSENHLSKVFQRMSKVGLVRSVRGPHGGFLLAMPPTRIRLFDIFTAIEGEFKIEECLLPKRICRKNMCILGQLIGNINKEVLHYLKVKKLSDFKGIYKRDKTL